MAGYNIDVFQVGEIMTNCFLFSNKESKEAILIDPGDEAKRLMSQIDRKGVKLMAILITHAHFDHIMAAQFIADRLKVPIVAGVDEKDSFKNPRINMAAMYGGSSPKPSVFLEDGEKFTYAGFDIKIMFTPGHTQGSVCYYLEKESVLFSGDTLFYGSVGRMDFPTGSESQMSASLNNILMKLPENVVVYPGHGPKTTIGHEKMHNPYVK